ncbi:MAG: VanZ family protein [Chloroflexota bacterium]
MWRWLALGLWYAAILFTSSLTSTPETGQHLRDLLVNKGGHVFVYSVLGWLVTDALTAPAAGLSLRRRLALAVAVLTGAALASLDETRQSFVYGRTALASDAVLDTVALAGGALLQQWLAGPIVTLPLPASAGQGDEKPGQQRAVEG